MLETYAYQINSQLRETDGASPQPKEEGRFELMFTGGALSVITHRPGGIFNLWLDNLPGFSQFLHTMMARGDPRVKGGLCTTSPDGAPAMLLWEAIQHADIPPEHIAGTIHIEKIHEV